jgi:ribosome-associated translation inhibitor RaiA
MRMSLSFHGTNQVSRAGLREIVRQLAKPIERRLASLPPDAVLMQAHIDKNPAHHLFRVSLRLKVPGRVLAATLEDHDLSAVLIGVFEDLERRTGKYLARSRGDHQRRRAPVRHRVGMRAGEHAVQELRDAP